jgi:hypothetical protein
MKFFKKIAIVLSVGIIISGIFDVQCARRSYTINDVVDRLCREYSTNANRIVLALYTEDVGALKPYERKTVEEWKKRLHEHVVDERRHFAADPGMGATGVFNGQATSSCNITLGEAIGRLARAEAFEWSKSGNAILEYEDSVDHTVLGGVVVSELDRYGNVKSSDPAAGVWVELKFSTAANQTDVGTIYCYS